MKILFTLFFCIITLFGCNDTNIENNNYEKNNSGTSNVSINRVSINVNPEEELSSFSTKIYIKEENRQQNVSLTCSKLNGCIVKSGETFSFCNTVGKATSEQGYKKADIFDSDGNIVKGYGGGNCQISSTLYNAVLNMTGLTVIERHEHSRKVNYVESGKDAAVAYGSVDFKFRNDNNYDIKIYASSDTENINIKIVKI